MARMHSMLLVMFKATLEETFRHMELVLRDLKIWNYKLLNEPNKQSKKDRIKMNKMN